MIGNWWRRRREARVLLQRAIPDSLWLHTLQRYPFLHQRDEADRAELRRLATLFLADKEFSGAGGLVVTDEMAVAVAAQACLPILRLGLASYDSFVGIVMNMDIYFRSTSLFNTIIMLVLLLGGIGLVARSLRPRVT